MSKKQAKITQKTHKNFLFTIESNGRTLLSPGSFNFRKIRFNFGLFWIKNSYNSYY